MSRNQFSTIRLNNYTVRATTRGSLVVGGVAVGGGGSGGVVSDTTFTQGNRLAIFNGTDGNTINDTGIYHVFNEDNGAFLFSPTGSNFIQLDSGEVRMQNENTGNRVRVEESRITIRSYTGDVRIRGDTGVAISSELDMDDYKITNVAIPTNPGDVATKGYVDNNTGGLSSQWVTLTQSDIQGLHVYPGKTLVEGVADNVIIVDSLEFIRGEQGVAYSATGVNMYVNYMGNYVDPAQSYTWKIPADAVQAGGTGLLTSTGGSQGISVNNASFQPVTVGQSAILMSDSAITGAGNAVTVKVNYRLSPRG